MKRLTYWGLFWLLILVIVLFIGVSYLMSCLPPNHFIASNSDSINALFSGLAFATLIYTIMQQREDLDVQHQQLIESVKEQKAATDEFKKQNENIELQRFESIFFQMINHQLNTLISGSSPKNEYSSALDAIKHVKNLFARDKNLEYTQIFNSFHGETRKIVENFESVESNFVKYFKRHENSFELYFRTTISITRFLNSNREFYKLSYSYFLDYLRNQITEDIADVILYYFVFVKEPDYDFTQVVLTLGLHHRYLDTPDENFNDFDKLVKRLIKYKYDQLVLNE